MQRIITCAKGNFIITSSESEIKVALKQQGMIKSSLCCIRTDFSYHYISQVAHFLNSEQEIGLSILNASVNNLKIIPKHIAENIILDYNKENNDHLLSLPMKDQNILLKETPPSKLRKEPLKAVEEVIKIEEASSKDDTQTTEQGQYKNVKIFKKQSTSRKEPRQERRIIPIGVLPTGCNLQQPLITGALLNTSLVAPLHAGPIEHEMVMPFTFNPLKASKETEKPNISSVNPSQPNRPAFTSSFFKSRFKT